MAAGTFTVLDYKLKTYHGTGPSDPHAGTPMGLFLLDDPDNAGFAVCVHIHFKIGDTNVHQRINLVHHKKPPMGSLLYYEEDHDGMSKSQIKKSKHKIEVPLDGNATLLVEACRQFVDENEKGRWKDVSQWNMTGKDEGIKKLFRLRERSAWEDSYLKYIEKFDLPKVSGTSSNTKQQ